MVAAMLSDPTPSGLHDSELKKPPAEIKMTLAAIEAYVQECPSFVAQVEPGKPVRQFNYVEREYEVNFLLGTRFCRVDAVLHYRAGSPPLSTKSAARTEVPQLFWHCFEVKAQIRTITGVLAQVKATNEAITREVRKQNKEMGWCYITHRYNLMVRKNDPLLQELAWYWPQKDSFLAWDGASLWRVPGLSEKPFTTAKMESFANEGVGPLWDEMIARSQIHSTPSGQRVLH